MITNNIFHIIWVSLAAILVVISFRFKDRTKAMVAQVQTNVTVVSYDNPVRIKKLYVTPGQRVDSGEVLLEVDLPGIMAEITSLETEKYQLEFEKEKVVENYFQNPSSVIFLMTVLRR